MDIIETISELKNVLVNLRNDQSSLALVPTMGALHDGHLALVKLAKSRAAKVIVSIFVNPAQFNDKKDFDVYPRTVEKDCALLEKLGVNAVFAPPNQNEIYPAPYRTWINVDELSVPFEGASRPGHFRGVATVVTILFNLIRPDFAIFGEKDFQQLRIVEQLTQDLELGIEIVRAPIIRETGGLAMSSRNVRLSTKGRESALALSRGLRIAADAFKGGERRAAFLRSLVLEALRGETGVSPDYVAIVEESSLKEVETITSPSRVLIAAAVEGVRLIDNAPLAP
jgi:pantoate--beta-alanine ligase